MAELTLKVLDQNGKTICESRGEDYVSLVCNAQYQEGDRIVLETLSERNAAQHFRTDQLLLLYTAPRMRYENDLGIDPHLTMYMS